MSYFFRESLFIYPDHRNDEQKRKDAVRHSEAAFALGVLVGSPIGMVFAAVYTAKLFAELSALNAFAAFMGVFVITGGVFALLTYATASYVLEEKARIASQPKAEASPAPTTNYGTMNQQRSPSDARAMQRPTASEHPVALIRNRAPNALPPTEKTQLVQKESGHRERRTLSG